MVNTVSSILRNRDCPAALYANVSITIVAYILVKCV